MSVSKSNFKTNAIGPSPNAPIPGIWTESVRMPCRLTVTGFLLFGLVIALGGCAVPVMGSEPLVFGFNREPDSLIGNSRSIVWREFGPPKAHFVDDSDGATFFVYEKDTQQKVFPLGLVLLLAGLGGGGAGGGPDLSYVKREYSCVLLRFGPDERLVDYSVSNRSEDGHCTDVFASELAESTLVERGDPNAKYYESARTMFSSEEYARLAAQGDPEEQYQAGYFAGNLVLSWPWYCLAANQGHRQAQYALGNYYLYGHGGISKDLMKAYVWYSLATLNGNPRAVGYRDDLANKMIPGQIVEAKRLVAEWNPNPAECEMATSPES